MKKSILLTSLFFLMAWMAHGQDMKSFKLYKPAENAEEMISKAVDQAARENKHVFIQVGGNWCIWCARFHQLITTDKEIDSLVRANYIVYHLNYSSENTNDAILEKYGFPQRFGFPVFLVLDGKGKLLHTQNSVYLEDGKTGYTRNAVIGFFKDWSPSALDPSHYKK